MDTDGQGRSGRGPALTGTVVGALPNAMYRVRLDEGTQVLAHVAGRVEKNFIRLLAGDRVRIELSPIDRGRGRIVGKVG